MVDTATINDFNEMLIDKMEADNFYSSLNYCPTDEDIVFGSFFFEDGFKDDVVISMIENAAGGRDTVEYIEELQEQIENEV